MQCCPQRWERGPGLEAMQQNCNSAPIMKRLQVVVQCNVDNGGKTLFTLKYR